MWEKSLIAGSFLPSRPEKDGRLSDSRVIAAVANKLEGYARAPVLALGQRGAFAKVKCLGKFCRQKMVGSIYCPYLFD